MFVVAEFSRRVVVRGWLGLLVGVLLLQGGGASAQASDRDPFMGVGERTGARVVDGAAVTEGVIRVRRRHENDMDFAKYNPFYWEGRLTRYRIEDFTAKGQKKIKFTLLTEWPQDSTKFRGVDVSAVYIGDPLAHETERSKFAINARMKHVKDYRHFEYVLDEGAFKAHAAGLQVGKLLTIEFRFFNTEAFAGWAEQKARNVHNLSAYYSEFIRVRVGEPGVLIDDFQEPNALPSVRRYAGGWTTIPTVRVEPWRALQQQAFNLTWENGSAFLVGRSWFHTDFVTGEHVGEETDDKPSVFFAEMEAARKGYAAGLYNATSCSACHVHNGSALQPLEIGAAVHTTIAKTMDPATGARHAAFGVQLQTAGADAEGTLMIEGYEEKEVVLDDGTVVTLSRPKFTVEGVADQVALSVRRPAALIGLGLLEAVPNEAIEALAAANGGEVSRVGESIGRFGWKASQPTVRDQIRDALVNDMGVTTAARQALDSPREPGDVAAGKAALGDEAVDELVAYTALLGVPPRNDPEAERIVAGEQVFHRLGCATCHQPTLRTGASEFAELTNQTIHPYTDLLLHDMGEGLADEGHGEMARKWRTAPLWGLKNARDATAAAQSQFRAGDTDVTYEQTHAASAKGRVQLLHDGRARSLAEAILWHGGAAEESAKRYKALPKEDREALEAFLWDL